MSAPRSAWLAVLGTAAIAASVLVSAPSPAQAATPAPAHHRGPKAMGEHLRPHMGSYDAARFQSQAASLPPSLTGQLKSQLGITPAQFLADGQAAADAGAVVQQLQSDGVAVTGAQMSGTTLTVSVADASDLAAVEATGADATVAAALPTPHLTARALGNPADGSSPLQGGDLWFYLTNPASGEGTMCSTGFTGYSRSTGTREFVTAGHCADYVDTGEPAPSTGTVYMAADSTPAGYDIGLAGLKAVGKLQQSSFVFGGDRQADSGIVAITAAGAKVSHTVTTWGSTTSGATASSTASQGAQSGGSPIPILGAARAISGEPICHSGARTGWQCGRVNYADALASIEGTTEQVEGIDTSVCVLEGDSGGSFVSGNYAVGVLSAGSYVPRASTGAASNLCAPGGDSLAFPMAATHSGQSTVATTQPDFELGVAEPRSTVTPVIGSAGTTTGVTGTLSFAGGAAAASGTHVSLSIDGGTTSSTTSAASGGAQKWRFATSTLAPGTHSYALTIGTGHSAVTTRGAFTVPPVVKRLAGADRYATSVAVSRDTYPTAGSAKVVVVASGQNFPDALSAAPAAAKLGGPLLLTQPGSLPAAIATEIKRLRPGSIVVAGGPNAVSPAVATALGRIAPTRRIAGADRYATSLALATYAFGTSATSAFVATGTAFPDALSASAFAGAKRMPVLLVNGHGAGLPTALTTWMRSSHITHVSIAGGTAAVSSTVSTALKTATGTAPSRFGGADRYATSQLINAQFGSAKVSYLAAGANFPDALSGAAAAGTTAAPLYLVQSNCVPGPALTKFATWNTAAVRVLGGPNALGSGVVALRRCS